jgi:hypothetical protein
LGTSDVVLNFSASSVPDKFVVDFDGSTVIDTGFRGSSIYNSQLNVLGYPNVSGGGTGSASFIKSNPNPTTATITITSPLNSIEWSVILLCPSVPPTPSPTQTPTNTPTNTQTSSQTPTNTITQTQTQTPSYTPTNTITKTQTQTPSQTPTNTITPTKTPTSTPASTPPSTPASTVTPTKTPTSTPPSTPTTTQTPTSTQVYYYYSAGRFTCPGCGFTGLSFGVKSTTALSVVDGYYHLANDGFYYIMQTSVSPNPTTIVITDPIGSSSCPC